MKKRTFISWSILLACGIACSAIGRDVSAARGRTYRGSSQTSQQRSRIQPEEKIPLTDPPPFNAKKSAESSASTTEATDKTENKTTTTLTAPVQPPAESNTKPQATEQATSQPAKTASAPAPNQTPTQTPKLRRLPRPATTYPTIDATYPATDAPQIEINSARTAITVPDPPTEMGLTQSDTSTDTTPAPAAAQPATKTTLATKTTSNADATDAEQTGTTETARTETAASEKAAAPEETVHKETLQKETEETNAEQKNTEKTDAEQTLTKKASIAPVAPVAPARKLTTSQIRLRNKIRTCLAYYYQRPENISKRSPWGVMHWLIGYGVDAEVIAGNRHVNAIGWLCWNQPCRGMQLLYMKDGEIGTRHGPGYQGHEGQLLSMLALSRVKIDYPMMIDGKELTVADLVEHEKLGCVPRSELSFQLIGLSHYLPSDATWTSRSDDSWSIPRLISEEIVQPINGACCGGTHRLVGLSTAVRVRAKRNEPMTGQWLRAQTFVTKYQRYIFKLQNRDGSFSTDWFKGRADSGDVDRKLQTTGHILDWLLYSLPEQQLTDARVVRAVDFLSTLMLRNRTHEWEVGPRGHALRALALYGDRVFGDKPGQRKELLARRLRK